MTDILFRTDSHIFSYHVAGVCIQNDSVLLQKPTGDDGFAFPGGHVAFGETNKETLRREFREEISAEIVVGNLKWVAEVFFDWGGRPCHQICLYYAVTIEDAHTPADGVFTAQEQPEGRNFTLEFHWIPLDRLNEIEVYPVQTKRLLRQSGDGVAHFVYREGGGPL